MKKKLRKSTGPTLGPGQQTKQKNGEEKVIRNNSINRKRASLSRGEGTGGRELLEKK